MGEMCVQTYRVKGHLDFVYLSGELGLCPLECKNTSMLRFVLFSHFVHTGCKTAPLIWKIIVSDSR